MVFSLSGRWLAATGDDGEVHLYDLSMTNPEKSVRVLGEHAGETAAAFSADECWLVTGDETHIVRIWDVKRTEDDDRPPPIRVLKHESKIKSPGFPHSSPRAEGVTFEVATRGNRFLIRFHTRVWDEARSETVIWDFEEACRDQGKAPVHLPSDVESVQLSPDGRWGVSGTAMGLADPDGQRQQLWSFCRTPHTSTRISGRSHNVCFSPDSQFLVTVGAGRIWLYRLNIGVAQGFSQVYLDSFQATDANRLEFSSDSELMAAPAGAETKLWFLER
jgi:hypothetical protein